MMPITPQTSDIPSAARAKMAPISTPSSSSWTGSSGASKSRRRFSIRSLRQLARPDQLRLRPLLRRNHFVGSVQHLVEDHLLGDVLAGRVELDWGEHRRHVGRGDGVAHLLRIKRAGPLECVGEDQYAGGRLRRLVGRGIAELLVEALRVLL